jgi:hypothetical protein
VKEEDRDCWDGKLEFPTKLKYMAPERWRFWNLHVEEGDCEAAENVGPRG